MVDVPESPEAARAEEWATLAPLLPPLGRLLGQILMRIEGALGAEDAWLIEDVLDAHGLCVGVPPEWMTTLLQALLEGRVSDERVPYPTGYPHGENGLINVLLDIGDARLGVVDTGEDWTWSLPSLGVELTVFREGGPYYLLRRQSP